MLIADLEEAGLLNRSESAISNQQLAISNSLAIIPARYASTRFPGKPLAHRTGKYLIQHVVERVRLARHVGRIIVATDDARILQAVESFGAEAMMTRADHPNGTSRLAEVVERLAACGLTPESSPDPQPLPDLIVNVQGDEPDIDPGVIEVGR